MSDRPRQPRTAIWRDVVLAGAMLLTMTAQLLAITAEDDALPLRYVILVGSAVFFVVALLRVWAAWRRRRTEIGN